jgi:hypothetical protein
MALWGDDVQGGNRAVCIGEGVGDEHTLTPKV